jgi:hypothetical protein
MIGRWLASISEWLNGLEETRAAVVRVYRQAMAGELARAQPATAAPDDPAGDDRSLATLFSLETAGLDGLPDTDLRGRLWSTLDRFERTVPGETRMRYWQLVPPLSDDQWSMPEFMRLQLKALLRQIHRSVLIKQAREEQSIRLRTLVFGVVAALVLAFLGFAVMAAYAGKVLTLGFGYYILFTAGVLGAAVSYMRRLQAAIDHDAAAGDGLTELQALGGSRISALSSIVLGGIFAILVYWLSIAGLFTYLVPETAAQPSLAAGQSSAEIDVASRQAALDALSSQGADEAALGEARTALADAQKRKAVLDEAAAALLPGIATCPTPPTDTLGMESRYTACSVGSLYARLLGLADARSFYLLLVLAFLAGFAEQLVPDKLKQLTQRYSGPTATS